MKDELTMANINLFAVLRNLEDLCQLDAEMNSLIMGRDISVQFTVKDGPQAYLLVKDGKCQLERGKKKCKIKLYFRSPAHLNSMFTGESNPIPLKGLTRLNFLKNEFQTLTDRLSYYLKPTDTLLTDDTYFKINTILTTYTVFYTLVEIGNHDRIGKLNAHRITDGVIAISVLNGGPTIYIQVQDGHLKASKKKPGLPKAVMTFANLQATNALLNGKTNSYSCLDNGDLTTRGYLPMIDNLNKILSQVPFYLK